MKKSLKLSAQFTVIILVMAFFTGSCQKANSMEPLSGNEKLSATITSDTLDCSCIINASPTVTEAEIEMLKYMREEEKLARDVYIAMYELYPIPIFRNIAQSEQNHMNQVLCLLQHYGLPDPASADTGVFNNTELQELYNALILQGSGSQVEALKAGATVEDKDIFDLEQDMANSSNPAILNIFGKLSCASGNHIRAFSGWLTDEGVTYVPQYISQEEYERIISLQHQSCGGKGKSAQSGKRAHHNSR
jgi:hypothetical protein